MLHGNLMPCADHAALKQRERGFNRVRAHRQTAFIADVFFFAVIYRLVFAAILCESKVVELRFVRHDDIDSGIDIPGNDVVHLSLIEMFGVDKMQAAATLANADDWRVLLPLVFVLCVTANAHLIDFNRALEFVLRFRHCLADSMAQVPCGLIGNPEHPFNLIGTHSLAGFRHQIGNQEPFRQREMGVVEDRTDRDGELIFARIADIHFALGYWRDVIAIALQALHAVGKSQML